MNRKNQTTTATPTRRGRKPVYQNNVTQEDVDMVKEAMNTTSRTFLIENVDLHVRKIDRVIAEMKRKKMISKKGQTYVKHF